LWISNSRSRPKGETEKIVIGPSLLAQQHPFYMLLAERDEERGGNRLCQFATVHR
jgi:hypothetical protein